MPRFENSYILVSEEYIPSMKIRFPFETVFASDPVRVFLPEDNDINIAKAGIDSLKPFLDSSIHLSSTGQIKTVKLFLPMSPFLLLKILNLSQ